MRSVRHVVCVRDHYPTPMRSERHVVCVCGLSYIYNVEPLILIKYFLVCVCVWVGAPLKKPNQKKRRKSAPNVTEGVERLTNVPSSRECIPTTYSCMVADNRAHFLCI